MADTTKISAVRRTEFGKGAARRIRRADQVPAVLYGHGTDPVHLSLPGHDTMLALKQANALLEISLDGKTHLALVKDVQREVIKRFIEHVDLVVIRRGERVTVDIAVHTTGEAAPETVVTVENSSVTVSADATKIPENVEVSVEGLEAGSQILAGALELPSGVELDGDPEMLVVNVSAAVTAEALEAELAEAEAEAGIEREESEDAEGEGDSADGSGDSNESEGGSDQE
ncbi:50S ribosomal protein L25/general stress protein Ctc [Agilicoccus flavus]|uniref:50S ribosomal protein L25/general stress protein Ctc n=1 Tax=Agilicoccus flavus TaxID=2775968 RepID=UPI001CF6AE71|nr:50S ribosomal protein L25/general stress protein Ctc [Agilicoccus flavus]